MTRHIIRALLRLVIRVFFRRIEIAGVERVPRHGPVIFVVNHPNGLVDPLFVLSHTPRHVSFLAKAPLFRTPVLSFLVRALDSIPVYRRQDEGGEEAAQNNRETFELSHALLARGGTIAICPEGVSHNEPSLRPLKSGVARIALGAASTGEALDLKIVPAGLFYTAKTTFRSAALLYFGEPIKVEAVALGPDGEPSREAVQALSHRIEEALREATLNADQTEALATVARAERIFSSEGKYTEGEPSLEHQLKLRRRFIEGYAFHRAQSPERLAALEARIRRYEEELKQIGVEPQEFSASFLSEHVDARHLFTSVLIFLLLAPLALAGALLHYPAYRLAGFFATRFSQNSDDVVSTFKVLTAMLLFPLTWIVLAGGAYLLAGGLAALCALLFVPLAGYVALRFFEEFDRFVGGARALAFFVTQRRFFKQLLAERKAIYKEIFELGDEAARAGALKTVVEA